jgi:hypothetical protein
MKIVLELNEDLQMKVEMDTEVSYPIAFGLLQNALVELELRYRLARIIPIDKEHKEQKRKAREEQP